MIMWLGDRQDFPIVGQYFDELWMVQVFGYGGLLLDLFIVPFLLWKRTRPFASSADPRLQRSPGLPAGELSTVFASANTDFADYSAPIPRRPPADPEVRQCPAHQCCPSRI